MNIKEIKKKAKTLGIKTGRIKKSNLIQAIQKAEGNFECFETSAGHCDQLDCCWKSDCLKQR